MGRFAGNLPVLVVTVLVAASIGTSGAKKLVEVPERWNFHFDDREWHPASPLGIHHPAFMGSPPLPTMYATYFGTGGRTLESDDNSALQCSQNRYPV